MAEMKAETCRHNWLINKTGLPRLRKQLLCLIENFTPFINIRTERMNKLKIKKKTIGSHIQELKSLGLDPWRREQMVVPKTRYVINTLRCVISQKSAHLILYLNEYTPMTSLFINCCTLSKVPGAVTNVSTVLLWYLEVAIAWSNWHYKPPLTT
jgi:hypothetical protein